MPDPKMVSGQLIDVAGHLSNLKFRVWEKMRNIIEYSESKYFSKLWAIEG